MSTTLVLGAARSGKSRHARSLLPADARVTLVIPTRPHEDAPTASVPGAVQPPPGWQTIETQELSRVLMAARGPVLLDTLDTWVAGVLDQIEGWEDPERSVKHINELVDELLVAMVYLPFDIVAVSTDPGWIGHDLSPASRLHRDLVAVVNRRVGASAQRVHLVVAGRVIDLSGASIAQGAQHA